jgi:hypothetical protein
MSFEPLPEVKSFEDLLENLRAREAGRFPQAVWHAAAIAHSFDAKMYEQCASGSTVPFEDFTAHSDITRVDDRRVMLRDAARDRIINELVKKPSLATEAAWRIYVADL